jgi:hypothetical protein
MNESESGLNRYMRDIWRFPLLTLQGLIATTDHRQRQPYDAPH